jgi:hypothetical protein
MLPLALEASEFTQLTAPSLAEEDTLPGTMSCEVAAGIISSMRGYGDNEQARSQLGCEGREHCTIDNMRILQVMEMY